MPERQKGGCMPGAVRWPPKLVGCDAIVRPTPADVAIHGPPVCIVRKPESRVIGRSETRALGLHVPVLSLDSGWLSGQVPYRQATDMG